MMSPRSFLAATLYLFSATGLFGYGNAGHEAIADVAAYYLKGTPAEKKVAELLDQPDENLARAATWPDRAKLPEKYLTDEMKDFVTHNPEHHSYHYCDVPFQETAYREGTTGTNPNDIVHIMQQCIQVLMDPAPAPENERHFTKRQALFLLVHLAGDIHQPLHVGSSYVDSADKFVNPNTGAKGQEDAGANYFKLTKSISLHGYWDTVAVKAVRDHVAAGQDFAAYLLEAEKPRPEWKTEGALITWPEKWASDVLQLAPEVFRGIALSERHTEPADERRPEHDEWKVTLPPDYAERAAGIVQVELAQAGYRLAQLLQAIWP